MKRLWTIALVVGALAGACGDDGDDDSASEGGDQSGGVIKGCYQGDVCVSADEEIARSCALLGTGNVAKCPTDNLEGTCYAEASRDHGVMVTVHYYEGYQDAREDCEDIRAGEYTEK